MNFSSTVVSSDRQQLGKLYSQTCTSDHLCIEATCQQRPLQIHPQQCISTLIVTIQWQPVYKVHIYSLSRVAAIDRFDRSYCHYEERTANDNEDKVDLFADTMGHIIVIIKMAWKLGLATTPMKTVGARRLYITGEKWLLLPLRCVVPRDYRTAIYVSFPATDSARAPRWSSSRAVRSSARPLAQLMIGLSRV